MIRRPASLHAVPRRAGFPRFTGRPGLPFGTIRALRLPAVRPAALRFLRAWRCRRCCVLPVRSRGLDERPARGPGLLGFGQPVPSCVATETTGSPKFLAEPRLHLRRALRPRQDRRRLTVHVVADGAAPGAATSRAPALPLSRLNPPALVLAVYASPRRSPATGRKTRFRLLVRLCRAGSIRRVPYERFQRCFLHLILLSQACLAQCRIRGSGRSSSGRAGCSHTADRACRQVNCRLGPWRRGSMGRARQSLLKIYHGETKTR